MTAIRHIGFYVNDIQKLEAFYTSVFQMIPVCSMEPDSSVLFDELLGIRNARILTTKLVTPYGKKNGQGDMLELVKILSKDTDFKTDCLKNLRGGGNPISAPGTGHTAFGIDNMQQTVCSIIREQGTQETEIVRMRGVSLCCFCRDPEGNWIELIQRCEVCTGSNETGIRKNGAEKSDCKFIWVK